MAKRMGRPAWKPAEAERRQVHAMAGYGIAEDEIAKVIGVTAKTLRKHCAKELDTGKTVALAKVAETLYGRATDRRGGASTVTACIFWLKVHGGWRETTHNEHTGKNGGPIILEVNNFNRGL